MNTNKIFRQRYLFYVQTYYEPLLSVLKKSGSSNRYYTFPALKCEY